MTVGPQAKIEFNTGTGVYSDGFDGVVQASGSSYVPDGDSVWEVSVRKDVQAKANDDFKRRSFEESRLDRSLVTYVGVSLRRFSESSDTAKASWAEDRRSEGIWRDVVFYDLEDISEWLDQHAVLGFQVAIKLKQSSLIRSLGDWWENWVAPCQLRIGNDWLVSGRDQEAKQFGELIQLERKFLTISGCSQTDALAFAYSAVQSLPPEVADWLMCRSLYIPSLAAFEQVTPFVRNAILIPMEGLDDHHIGLVSPSNKVLYCGHPTKYEGGIHLPRVRVSILHERMCRDGLDSDVASRAARAARSGVELMRKELGAPPSPFDLSDLDKSDHAIISAALLVNRWSEENVHDVSLVAELAGTGPDEVERTLARVSRRQPPLIRKSGHVWFLTDDGLAWDQLGHLVTSSVLSPFLLRAPGILGESDPSFDLDPSERWKARLLGKSPVYSSHVKVGLARTFAVLSEHDSPVGSYASGHEISDRLVDQCVSGAGEKEWFALAPSLSLLAEASPDHFLAALEGDLNRSDPAVLGLFATETQPLMGGSRHSELLWSLERLCWSKRFLKRASKCLCALHERGFGNGTGNNPLASLRQVYVPWHPCTEADAEERMAVLDSLRQSHPVASWDLLGQLMPRDHDVAHPTSRPEFREWGGERSEQFQTQVKRCYDTVLGWMVGDAGVNAGRLASLASAFAGYPDEWLNLILERLGDVVEDIREEQERFVIWDGMSRVLRRHRSHPEAEWAMTAEQCDRYEDVMTSFEPLDVALRSLWLFQPWVDLGVKEDDYDQRHALIDEARNEALKAILRESGTLGIFDLAQRAELPGVVGEIAAKLGIWTGEDETQFLLSHLGSEERWGRQLAMGYAAQHFADDGPAWILDLLGGPEPWSAEQRAELLFVLPNDRNTWKHLDTEPEQVSKLYWSRINVWTTRAYSEDDYMLFARRMIDAGREADLLHLLSSLSYSGSSAERELLMVDALNALSTRESFEPGELSTLGSEVRQALEVLSGSGRIQDTELARLEFYFMPLVWFEYRPRGLGRALASDPKFFVELLSKIYPTDGESDGNETEARRSLAETAYKVLHAWDVLPGSDEGRINLRMLLDWLSAARSIAAEKGLLPRADAFIGDLLAKSQPDEDGIWPPSEVCQAIEITASDDLDLHVRIGRHNARGVTSRGVDDGGRLERTEEARYRSLLGEV
ncbi:MAG: hypothetical protein M9921_05725 [Fimbriimonadaceae bacterium]|nr:hypothetical protein [Fimbriimonadaceae bacterium]